MDANRRGGTEVDTEGAMSVSGDFSPEQKRYLEGLAAGVQIARAAPLLTRRE
jgi:hypothetical protein